MANQSRNIATAIIANNVTLTNCPVTVQAGGSQSTTADGGSKKNENTDPLTSGLQAPKRKRKTTTKKKKIISEIEEEPSTSGPRAPKRKRKTTTKKKKITSEIEEGIVIFDWISMHLQLFNPADNTLKQIQSFKKEIKTVSFTAVTLYDFVYVLNQPKSVLRLKYSDERATWERMPDMIYDHGMWPHATVMSGCIYVAGGSFSTEVKAMEKFDPSSRKWSSLENEKPITISNALVGAQDLIYSISGLRNFKQVERFDPASSTWTSVAPIKQYRRAPAAVEFNGKIFVLGGVNGFSEDARRLSSVEIYDPSTNTWSVMKNNMLNGRSDFEAFVINGDIYAVGGDNSGESIERYSSERDVWEEVQIQTKRRIFIPHSTKIQI